MANGRPGRPAGIRYKGDWFKDQKTPKPLDERQLKYVDWLLDPRPAAPSGKGYAKDFAALHGVSHPVLTQWRNQARFKAEMERRIKELPFDSVKIAHVVGKMFEKALEGDNKAIEMALKYTRQFEPTKVEVTTKGASDMSDAELREAMLAAAQSLAGAGEQADDTDEA